MLNYYTVKELADKDGGPTGTYHYTVTNDHVTRPHPCCAGKPGLPTREAAYEAYRQYTLDHAMFNQRYSPPPRGGVRQFPCEVCGTLTDGFASVGEGHMEHHSLCDAHQNRESLDPLVKAGDSWSSY